MTDDQILPPGVRFDPRRGIRGGYFVFVTCPICGREHRQALSRLRYKTKIGRPQWCCSEECAGVMRRKGAI